MTKVLDKGFVKLIDSMGDDLAIVQAARVSYGNGTKTKRENDKLINYLMKNKHMSPFEMVIFKFNVKLPIFVARQWAKHRTGAFNEVSARYSEMPDDFYIPELSRVQPQSKKNKQGSDGELKKEDRIKAQEIIIDNADKSYIDYENLLKLGVSRELARMTLPVNLYTQFVWKVDLRNLLGFIQQRSDSHAQWEIQQYSNAIYDIIKEIVPVACESFEINN